jgi:fumarylacetoacetase
VIATVDETHDARLESWVESANDPACEFPIQNLPFGRFRLPGERDGWHIGVAIGDQVLDLQAAGLSASDDIADVMSATSHDRRQLRRAVSRGLSTASSLRESWQGALHRINEVDLGLPCAIGDYTDFYTGIHHAVAVGKLFRPDNPLLPNYKWIPIGYHGRSSSIRVSGEDFHRPSGQVMTPGAAAPTLQPTGRLDFELELGIFAGTPNQLGHAITINDAEEHLFGIALLNDWSARDIQAWEYQPLGPFLAKNFATTISPWIVTLEALAPFREKLDRPDGDPQPLAYLDSPANRAAGAIDINLEVWLQTSHMREKRLAPVRLCESNYLHAYWTPAQLVAHHTVNGCNLRTGDLLGTGTLSGPSREASGSLLELTQGGKTLIHLPDGETRTFLEDGDQVTLRAHCSRTGYRRIGFGDCQAAVLPTTTRFVTPTR